MNRIEFDAEKCYDHITYNTYFYHKENWILFLINNIYLVTWLQYERAHNCYSNFPVL